MRRLTVQHAEDIGIEGFIEACSREVRVPLSEAKIREVAASAMDVRFRRYRKGSQCLLASCLFAASDTDAHRTRWYSSSDPVPLEARCMITYGELLQLPALLDDYLQRLREDRVDRPGRSSPRILTLHCSACDARWMLDGNHGFVRICVSGQDEVVTVTEMTSPELGMRGCQCIRPAPDATGHRI